MVKPSNHPKLQHYVPKLLLRGFSQGKKKQVWVFDKKTDKCFKSSIRNVAAEKGFYDLDRGDAALTLEPGLASLENKAAAVLEAVRRSRSIAVLSSIDRLVLATFVIVQFMRVKGLRERIAHDARQIRRLIRKLTEGQDQVSPQFREFLREDESGDKALAMHMTSRPIDFVPHLLDKEWALLSTTGQAQFFVSDHPVNLQNQVNVDPLRGTVGFAVEGIEIHMPIGDRLCLGFYCAQTMAEMRRQYAQLRATGGAPLGPGAQHTIDLMRGLDTGEAVPVPPAVVENLNSAQVWMAERFLYARGNSFSLARDMIERDQSYRSGPRNEVIHPALTNDAGSDTPA